MTKGWTMDKETEKTDRTTGTLRWMARAIGTIVVLFWLLIAIGYAITEPPSLSLDDIVMAVLVAGTTIGVFISWTNERTGGIITLLFGIAHSTFALIASGHNHALAMLVSGGPFILVGILFLITDSRSKKVDPLSDPDY
jgi:succinate dehydrogenase hydrophobic anchor subunit